MPLVVIQNIRFGDRKIRHRKISYITFVKQHGDSRVDSSNRFINYVQNGTKRRCQPAVHNPTANGPVFVIRVPSDIGQGGPDDPQVLRMHVDDSDHPVLRGGIFFHEPERPAAVRQYGAGYRSSWPQHDS